MSIGQKIDDLYTRRAERLKLSQEVEELKLEETKLRLEIIAELKGLELNGGKGTIATAAIMRKTKSTVLDWSLVWNYIFDNRAAELMQKRISETAWAERRESGILIPGTEVNTFDDLSLTKR